MTEFIECQICHKKLRILNNWHLAKHSLSLEDYKIKFPNTLTCSEQTKFRVGSSTRNKKRESFSQKISSKGNGMFGRVHSSKSIEKMQKNRKGKGKNTCGKYVRTLKIKEKISNSVSSYIFEHGLPKTLYTFNLNQRSKHYFGRRGTYRSRSYKVCNFRSSWELSVMIFLDKHPEVEKWQYEPFVVPYSYQGKTRSYIPDFYIDFSGIEEIWEIKPEELVNHCELTWEKIYALENFTSYNYNFQQVSVLTQKEILQIKNTNWQELYSRYGFSIEDLENREREMAALVRINDISYRGEK